VIGKGDKQRFVYVHENVVPALERWLAVMGVRSGPVFRSVDKWGHIGDAALSHSAVYFIVSDRRAQVGLPPLTPHDFRRTFIGDLEDAGGHISQAQELAGHDSVDTTAKYVRHNARALRAAVDRLPIPPMPVSGGKPA
jgi:integrase